MAFLPLKEHWPLFCINKHMAKTTSKLKEKKNGYRHPSELQAWGQGGEKFLKKYEDPLSSGVFSHGM
jgi:hypothetical protein